VGEVALISDYKSLFACVDRTFGNQFHRAGASRKKSASPDAGRSLRATVRSQGGNMDTTTLLIIIIVLLLLFGGGWYGRGRWF
jgi:hypothetical protein